MARRLLVGAAAALLGVATAEFVFPYTMARIARRHHLRHGERLFRTVRIDLVDATRALLSVALLHAPPLCGERLRAAERGVARALADGATDLRLLLALLAARDGRFDEALRLYGEAALEDPSDLRPKALGHLLCHLTDHPVVAPLWWEGSRHLLLFHEISFQDSSLLWSREHRPRSAIAAAAASQLPSPLLSAPPKLGFRMGDRISGRDLASNGLDLGLLRPTGCHVGC